MISASDLKSIDLGLPEEFLDILPEKCSYCNLPLEISETLTDLHCSNPRCPSKISQRVQALLSLLGIDFNNQVLEDFVLSHKIINPVHIFRLQLLDEAGSNPMAIFKQQSSNSFCVSSDSEIASLIPLLEGKNNFYLWEYIRAMQLPLVSSSAYKLFREYTSLTKAYQDLLEGGIAWVQEKLGWGTEQEYYRACKLYQIFTLFKDDLFDGLNYVTILDSLDTHLKILCLEPLGENFITLNSFTSYLKQKFPHIEFIFSTCVTSDLDYVVVDSKNISVSAPLSRVQGILSAAPSQHLKIVTAEELIAELERG